MERASIIRRCGKKRSPAADYYGSATNSTMRKQGLEEMGCLIHYMRSFVIAEVREGTATSVGFQCRRQTLEISQSNDVLRLREKRYSVALNLFPLQRPCGKFSLLSVVDIAESRDWTNCCSYLSLPSVRVSPWATYGILPAGLYTGISAFQLHLCSFIDNWEEDWSHTIDKIGDFVSVKVRNLCLTCHLECMTSWLTLMEVCRSEQR